jgi:hypothetical protein
METTSALVFTPTNTGNRALYLHPPPAPLAARYSLIDRKHALQGGDQLEDESNEPFPFIRRNVHKRALNFFHPEFDNADPPITEFFSSSKLTDSPPSLVETNRRKVQKIKDLAREIHMAIENEMFEDLLVNTSKKTCTKELVMRATDKVLRNKKRRQSR